MKRVSDHSLAAKIRAEFPHVRFNAVRRKGGEDHDVLILDGHLIFRFPKTKTYARTLRHELSLLASLSRRRLPCAVPRYRWIARTKTFGGYELIRGIKMTRTAFARRSAAEQKKIASQVARFLSALHTMATPASLPSSRNTATFPKRYFEKRRATVARGAGPELIARIDAFFRDAYLPGVSGFTKRVPIHNDFRDDHILLGKKGTGIEGVIDFGDAARGDPAFDFTCLWEYGEKFVKAVYRAYRGPKDRAFLSRSQTQYLRWAADELYYAIRNEEPREARHFRAILEKNLPR
jgi:aminoglycoside phosphotransferase (APT) family kinase protein